MLHLFIGDLHNLGPQDHSNLLSLKDNFSASGLFTTKALNVTHRTWLLGMLVAKDFRGGIDMDSGRKRSSFPESTVEDA